MSTRAYNLEILADDVIIDVPQCLEGTILRALRRAAKDFCEKTGIWEEELEALDLVESQTSYELVTGYDAYIETIVWVKMKNSSDDEFEDLKPIDESKYKLTDYGTLEFTHSGYASTSDITDGLQVKAELRPSYNSMNFPPAFLDRWGTALVAKAKADLMLSPRKPYSNPDMAGIEMQKYNAAVTKAKNKKGMGFKNSSPGVSA